MRNAGSVLPQLALLAAATLGLCSCSSMSSDVGSGNENNTYAYSAPANYASRLPQQIATNEKVVLVDPRVHAWGAYDNGTLVRAGLATAGSTWCPDLGRPCKTAAGSFRVQSLGAAECKSRTFPLPKGGAPMPYCMFFHGGQALHGVPAGEVVEGNISHGCVRLNVSDAEWLRFNFVNVGTKVQVSPY